MKIKRFIAKDAQEAMIKVKNELGRDAIILHTRKIKKQGIRALFSKPLVEVVAAIEDGSVAKPRNRQNPYEKKNDFVPMSNNIVDRKPKVPTIQKDEKINDEIMDIKDMLSSVLNKMEDNKIGLNIVKEDYKQALIEVGVNEELVNNILNAVESKTSFEEDNRELIRDLIINVIKDYLGNPTELEFKPINKPHIVFFIGPTGVGKTTTIAKLAAKESIVNNKKVALITADTYRIAAVEQLKTYSEILNIPISVIYEPLEIKGEIKKYDEMDYIFVDTAGRNHKNKELIKEVGELLKFADSSSTYLLLSLTTGYRDIESIINAYDFIDDYNIIFTKSDEASNLGNILNIKHLTNKPLSYITTGQSVPDDIEVINIEKIANQLVGG